jgi:hypothetical protein
MAVHALGSFAMALTILLPSVGIQVAQPPPVPQLPPATQPPQTPQSSQDRDNPVFRVQVWGDLATDFSMRVSSYVDLRKELEKGLPPLTVTTDPAEINRAVRLLARRIRVARAGAKEGDIFSPPIGVQFRKSLVLEMNESTWAVIMDENPGRINVRINGDYPPQKQVTTMPPNILAVLPKLPEDMEYRFLGRHLVLVDTRASVIVDRIPYAIRRK